jgi:hypothetical protein
VIAPLLALVMSASSMSILVRIYRRVPGDDERRADRT